MATESAVPPRSAVARLANRALDVGIVLVLAMGVLFPLAGARALTGDPVLINEVLVSHTGADSAEFVELFGVPGSSLAGLSLVVIEGDNSGAGTVDLRLDFTADAVVGGNGFYLVGNPIGLGATYGVTPDLAIATDTFENGSQTLALASTASLGAVGTIVTGSEAVVDAIALTDGGPSDAWFFDAPVVGPDDGFLPGGARRVTDGVDTDTAGDWVFADDQLGPSNTPTAATPFDAAPVAVCGPALTTAQGTAASAPVSATDPDGTVAAFTLEVVPDPGSIALGTVTPAPAPGAPGTTSVEVGATTPSGAYAATVTAWTDDASPQQAACVVLVTVEAPPAPDPEPDPGETPSVNELAALFDEMVASGAVDGSKAQLLGERLARAERFLADGQHAAALAQLQAFANQVAGMSPRWVSAEAAASLSSLVGALAVALAAS